ncbi:MAG: hypothetical protein HY655_00540 [Acidobacteria bacterium]|nr:hypothetical protein [Acidobacteriota bacterium]
MPRTTFEKKRLQLGAARILFAIARQPAAQRFERYTGGREQSTMTPKTVTLPADLYERVAQEAQGEGKTVDEVATEAVKRELARRWLERTRREAETRRGGMTDEEVEATVETAIREWRGEQRGR